MAKEAELEISHPIQFHLQKRDTKSLFLPQLVERQTKKKWRNTKENQIKTDVPGKQLVLFRFI